MNLPLIHESKLIVRGHPPHLPAKPDHPKAFTDIPVVLDPRLRANAKDGPVSNLLYAGFAEHLGRCIYGGLVDSPQHPARKELLTPQPDGRLGWRKDVQKVLAADGELAVPMMRWPGGNFVSNYHWQDGIGPVEKRPKRIELAWRNFESNMFGTDEFLDMCRANSWEPFICLNMGSGTLEEALAWVEYCNGTTDTYWANLRRKNTGRDEPHNVKYWGLGNEMWGPWQVGNLTAKEYAAMAHRWAHALKLVDPSIKLVSCGETGGSDWDREVLQTLVPFVDLHSIHFYSNLGHETSPIEGYEYEKNVFGPTAAECYIETCKGLIDLVNVHNAQKSIPARDVKIAYDEWNVWDELKGHTDNGLEQQYDVADMLAVAGWLSLLVRHHGVVGLACLAQCVNVIAPVLASPDGIVRQTIFWPLKYFGNYMKDGYVLAAPSMPDRYVGPTHPSYIQQMNMKPAYIDMVAMVSQDSKRICVSIANRHPSLNWTAPIEFNGFKVKDVEVVEVYSDDIDAINSFEEPDKVVPETKKYSASEWKDRKHVVRKHSWQFIIFNA